MSWFSSSDAAPRIDGLRVRALVFAAGFGTRLHPLTHDVPKALLPLAGEPLVGTTLRRLHRAGCEAAALNLHHLAESISTSLGRSWCGLPLEYSLEDPIQGTFGALYPLRAFLEAADAVVLINGDSLCRWPLRALVQHHRRTGADATLLVHRRPPDAVLGGGVGVDREGRVVALRDLETAAPTRRHVFAGCHVLSPQLLERAEPGFGDIVERLYQPLLREGRSVRSLVTSRSWHDLGTPARYLAAGLETLAGRWSWSAPRSHRSGLASIASDARIERSSIERGARVETGASIEQSLVLEGAVVGAGARLRRVIVGPGTQVPAGVEVEHRLIHRFDPMRPPRPGDTLLGDLTYTPLED